MINPHFCVTTYTDVLNVTLNNPTILRTHFVHLLLALSTITIRYKYFALKYSCSGTKSTIQRIIFVDSLCGSPDQKRSNAISASSA